ncbi:MAG: sulfur carrier protein ThiS [Deltaproteobacteria bacterium]|nr:sulfur carrier protein ThiS [Deltaproteobacteria bacterium]
MNKSIRIIVNGLEEEVPAGSNLAFLIEYFQEKEPALIVEYNHHVVFPQDYKTIKVKEKDSVEFIHPNIGG